MMSRIQESKLPHLGLVRKFDERFHLIPEKNWFGKEMIGTEVQQRPFQSLQNW